MQISFPVYSQMGNVKNVSLTHDEGWALEEKN